jgi:hypothetical protein
LGIVPEGSNARLRQIHDENTGPAEIVGELKQEKAEVGDFVWGEGYICEVMEVSRSKLGYVSYLLRYVEHPPIPDIKEDWFAGFEIRLFVKRSVAEQALQQLQNDPDEATRAYFLEKGKEVLGEAVAKLWHAVNDPKGQRRAPC